MNPLSQSFIICLSARARVTSDLSQVCTMYSAFKQHIPSQRHPYPLLSIPMQCPDTRFLHCYTRLPTIK